MKHGSLSLTLKNCILSSLFLLVLRLLYFFHSIHLYFFLSVFLLPSFLFVIDSGSSTFSMISSHYFDLLLMTLNQLEALFYFALSSTHFLCLAHTFSISHTLSLSLTHFLTFYLYWKHNTVF